MKRPIRFWLQDHRNRAHAMDSLTSFKKADKTLDFAPENLP